MSTVLRRSRRLYRTRASFGRLRCVDVVRHFSNPSLHDTPTTDKPSLLHTCGVDAEPLHCYVKGGYHPVHIGDLLKDGQYKVLHKLGWGGYSTIWAAKDQSTGRYVAVKISMSNGQGKISRELNNMRAIQHDRCRHPGAVHVVQLLDNFEIAGPNGTHECLVLELVGPSVSNVMGTRFVDKRLPEALAREVTRQALLGLDFLHEHRIGHGDLHTGNIAFALPSLHALSEENLCEKLGAFQMGQVTRNDGQPLAPGMPRYIIRPTSFPKGLSSLLESIKIVDFGESFSDTDVPATLHTPLAVRAPEVLFDDKFDHRVDLWSMACMIFELVAGQPPFDVMMLTPGVLVGQMQEMATDEIPERWRERAQALMKDSDADQESQDTLQSWLEELYFDQQKKNQMTPDDVRQVGSIVENMLRFDPSSRGSAQEILRSPWLSRAEPAR